MILEWFFFSSRRRHTRCGRDWSSDVCSSDLAVVLASFGGGTMVAVKAFAGGIGYALLMVFAGRKLLSPLGRRAEAERRISPGLLGVVLMLLMLAAWAMDAAGIHAVFGGFLLGAAMPRGFLAQEPK